MSKQIIFFVVVTIIFLMIVAVSIKLFKIQGLWYDLTSSFIVSICDKLPLIIGIAMGIIVSIILNVYL